MRIIGILLFITLAVGVFRHAASAWPAVHSSATQTYNLSANGIVAVEDSSGDVTVTGWSNDSVQVTVKKTAWSSDDLGRLDSKVESRNDQISIAALYPRHCSNCDISFDVRVPTGAHVAVATASGDVSVTSVDGPVRVDSASGDVEMHQIAGEVHAHTSSGDLTLKQVTGVVNAVASSGDIDASGLANDVDLVSSSGTVTASFARFDHVRAVQLESSSGDLDVTVPRGVGFKIEATTSSGSIDSNLDLPVRDRDSGAAVAAQVGSGRAAVQLRTTSGDISVHMR